jgi:hypothetical protein
LVELSGEVRPEALGVALVIAAKDGREEVALVLIDAGADTYIYSHSTPVDGPLFSKP